MSCGLNHLIAGIRGGFNIEKPHRGHKKKLFMFLSKYSIQKRVFVILVQFYLNLFDKLMTKTESLNSNLAFKMYVNMILTL